MPQRISSYLQLTLSAVIAFALLITIPFVYNSTLKPFFDLKESPYDAEAISFTKIGTGCSKNFNTWPKSTSKTTTKPWNLAIFAPRNETWQNTTNFTIPTHFEQMVDVNGDSLPDYVLYSKGGISNVILNGYALTSVDNYTIECVYLNTGQGWQKSYHCVYARDPVTQTYYYYGDCAA